MQTYTATYLTKKFVSRFDAAGAFVERVEEDVTNTVAGLSATLAATYKNVLGATVTADEPVERARGQSPSKGFSRAGKSNATERTTIKSVTTRAPTAAERRQMAAERGDLAAAVSGE